MVRGSRIGIDSRGPASNYDPEPWIRDLYLEDTTGTFTSDATFHGVPRAVFYPFLSVTLARRRTLSPFFSSRRKVSFLGLFFSLSRATFSCFTPFFVPAGGKAWARPGRRRLSVLPRISSPPARV